MLVARLGHNISKHEQPRRRKGGERRGMGDSWSFGMSSHCQRNNWRPTDRSDQPTKKTISKPRKDVKNKILHASKGDSWHSKTVAKRPRAVWYSRSNAFPWKQFVFVGFSRCLILFPAFEFTKFRHINARFHTSQSRVKKHQTEETKTK